MGAFPRILALGAGGLLFAACVTSFPELEEASKSDAGGGVTGGGSGGGPGGSGGSTVGGSAGSSAGGSGGSAGSVVDGGLPIVAYHGTAQLVAGNNATNATLPSVDPTHSVLVFGRSHSSILPGELLVRGDLAAEQITFTREGNTGAVDLSWHVLQHPAFSVRRGVLSGAGSTTLTNVPINPPVDLTRSFPMITTATGGSAIGANDLFTAHLSSNSNLELETVFTSAVDVSWQVVELEPGSVVQTGLSDLPPGAASANATIQGVDLARSFLFFSFRAQAADAGTYGPNAIGLTGGFSSATEIEFVRSANATTGLDIRWYVAQLATGSVQQEHVDVPGATASVSLDTIDVTRSIVFTSSRGYMGESAATGGGLGECEFTLSLAPTQLSVGRGKTTSLGVLDAFVVSY